MIAGFFFTLALVLFISARFYSKASRRYKAKERAPTPWDVRSQLAFAPLTPAHWKMALPAAIVGCVFLYVQSDTGVAAIMTGFLTSTEFKDVEVFRMQEIGIVKSIGT